MPNFGSWEWKFQQMKQLTDRIVSTFSESNDISEQYLAKTIKDCVNTIETTREGDA